MSRVDFVIGNPGHHLAAVRPLIEPLARAGLACRILSLCELRGFAAPSAALRQAGIVVRSLVPLRLRSPSSLGQRGRGGPGPGRRLLHSLSWLALGPRLRALEWPRPDLVVLPNDAAFPYDRIARQLNRRRIPYLLLQEGIRFPLPGEGGNGAYGTGGATAIAAWGESSAAYFRAQGVDSRRIFLTGSPRLEADLRRDWSPEADALRRRLGLGDEVLLYLSNPIDDQGFCTTAEKLALFARFVERLAPLLERPGFRLLVKLHGREEAASYRRLVAASRHSGSIAIVERAPLFALFRLARAAVVLSSTAGLEALAYGLPLGVLEIPGHGFAADYVDSGAAVPLAWSEPLAERIAKLMAASGEPRREAGRFVEHNLARTDGAAAELSRLIEELAG